jgi:predicted Rossmann-fold nucleotide-binding protein
VIARSADAVVAIGGGWGTLSELAFALRAGTPVVGVRTWELRRGGAAVAGVRAVADGRSAVAEALALLR